MKIKNWSKIFAWTMYNTWCIVDGYKYRTNDRQNEIWRTPTEGPAKWELVARWNDEEVNEND